MFRHTASYFFFGIGIAGLLFSLVRTYYLVWKMKKEGDEKSRRFRPFLEKKDGQGGFKV